MEYSIYLRRKVDGLDSQYITSIIHCDKYEVKEHNDFLGKYHIDFYLKNNYLGMCICDDFEEVKEG